MSIARTGRRSRPTWAVVGLCTLAVAASTGCALPAKQGSMGTLATAKQFNEVSITYRTESDRVNLAAGGDAGPTQMASFRQPSSGLLPSVTTTTLQIQHPHPDGIPGYARARVVVRPNGAEESEGGSVWSRLTGGDQGAGTGDSPQIVEAWVLDIPAWQVAGIMAKLQQQNFFRRAKVLGAETFLAVKADGAGFAKKYRSLPELDALILQVRREGRPLVRPTYGPVQRADDPAHTAYGPTHAYSGSAFPTR